MTTLLLLKKGEKKRKNVLILQSDFSGRFLYVFSRCDFESIAHDNGVLTECDSMRYGRRSIKSKNRDKKREGDAEREREREL
jgi:hypothetical protein